MHYKAWVLIGVIAAGLIALLIWLYRPQPDCAFSGWKKSVGVELDAGIKDLDSVKARVGISDSQVREFDTLMRDYALKYDAACTDFRARRMNQSEYTCLRRNMDLVLDDIRKFVQAVEAAKSITDADAQKEIVLKSLDDIRTASRSKYRSGCSSAMGVNPRKLSFPGNTPERSFQITNRGNNDFTFSVDDLPEAFDPRPPGGRLTTGEYASVSIIRTILPAPAIGPLKFHVRTNLQDDEEIEIAMDAHNATVLWDDLGAQVRQVAEGKHHAPTVGDALHVLDGALGSTSRVADADRYVLATRLLLYTRNDSEAQKALDNAVRLDGSFRSNPTIVIERGLMAARQNQPDRASLYFAEASRLAGPTDPETQSIAKLFSGASLIQQGDKTGANLLLKGGDVQSIVARNPSLLPFTERHFCSDKSETCTLEFRAEFFNFYPH